MAQQLGKIKLMSCAHCGAIGTLNRHDTIYGNDPEAVDKQTIRGRRLWCSNRGRRGGCGKTMSLLFAWILPGHTFTAGALDRLLKRLCMGGSIQAAWEKSRSQAALQSAYHLLQRLRLRMGEIRSALLKICRNPASSQKDPMIATYEHLRRAFSGHESPTAAFQYRLQMAMMG